MKKEIIYIDDYALVVSDEEIKEGDWYLRYGTSILRCKSLVLKFNDALNKDEVIISSDYCGDPYERSKHNLKKIIAHRPLPNIPNWIFEGVPLLPEFSKEDDVKKLALKTYPFSNSERNAFITGYNKAKETYKYTEDDLVRAMFKAIGKWMDNSEIDTSELDSEDIKNIIQSLNQPDPKLPVAIECEMKKDYLYNDDGDKYGFPVHPTNEVKTTTNSQGQIEIMGKYIYEYGE
jgi:hypothetical protein